MRSFVVTLSHYAFRKYFHAKRKKEKSLEIMFGNANLRATAAKVEWPKTPGVREQQKSRFRDSYYCHFNPWFSKTTATPKN